MLEPEELRREMGEEAERIANRYSTQGKVKNKHAR